jgi:hypothetical protein
MTSLPLILLEVAGLLALAVVLGLFDRRRNATAPHATTLRHVPAAPEPALPTRASGKVGA